MSSLPHIPFLYRLFFLYLEPAFALNGAIMCHFSPLSFLRTMSATAPYIPATQVIFDQLAACYVLFAFNEAIVLRVTKDIRVWRAMMLGMVLCDCLHINGSWNVMGWEASTKPWLWRGEDAVNMIILYGFTLLRLAFLGGWGVGGKNV
ncbi:hypothetical protein B0J11DRAFT_503660 [Dendryphion nanum]|uniref:DUF7704 domain-containing protein n=1 Tax=Dendryphion nanum TaxID=256645 RepID=A0A9P9E9K5_9PLEO|nr:hypothetical protein B0J11DRAFT_503660 [Dendryphion nanum]